MVPTPWRRLQEGDVVKGNETALRRVRAADIARVDVRRPKRPGIVNLYAWARRPSVFMRSRLAAAIAEQKDRLDARTRTQLFFLPIVLGLILAALLTVSFTVGSPFGPDRDTVMGHGGSLLWIYSLGALGALLSVTLGAIRGLTRHNYLLLTEFRLNVTRCLLGAASAAAVVAILETDLFNVGTVGADSALVLAVAIAAGFSERLLTNAISAVVQANGPK